MEIRHLITDSKLETREDSGKNVISGYFAVFGAEYEIEKASDWGPGMVETVGRDAFHLDRDRDVRALVNHDSTLVLGRTTAGTLQLRVDDHGLYGTIDVNEADPDAMALYARVKRGDVSQCSFGFNVLKRTVVRNVGEPVMVTLDDVELWEVSCCTFPAYTETEISARSKEYRAVLEKEAAEWRETMRARLAEGGAEHA